MLTSSATRINERSWAIDVISEINRLASNSVRAIRRAGGERTLNTGTQRLFPDVLLFGVGSTLIQGWELKMPDTAITDQEFISNATKKARFLNLNSFLLWNVTTAVLYVEDDGDFVPRHQWPQLAHITTRADVEAKRDEWIAALEIILGDLNDFFERGERRGWDAMFYPPENSGIEAEYLKPVLKSSSDIEGLVADADGVAFCCGLSIKELQARKHNGALKWIRRFGHAVNGTGKPLPEVLHRAGLHWYEMSDATLADLVTSLNPEQRIFVAKMRTRSFVNQRLIRFSLRDAAFDLELCHALLNSMIGVFFLEALGFGRGLGALDLNSTKLKKHLPILNPSLLSNAQASEIKKLFAPLLKRPIENISDEMQRADRQTFDDAVLRAFGLYTSKEKIRSAFQTLYEIRLAVKR